MTSLETRFSQARIVLLEKFPFLGNLAMYLQLRETHTFGPGWDLATMATDGQYIYVNPAFAKRLDQHGFVFVVAHEVLHCLFFHVGWPGAERRGDRDQQIWAEACDYRVNGFLIRYGLTMPTGDLRGFYNPAFDDLSVEQIYAMLKKESPSSGSLLDDHRLLQSNTEDGGNGQMKREWQSRMASAEQKARMAGNLPGCLSEMVTQILRPKVSFQEMLAMTMPDTIRHDYSMLPFNRRYLGSDILLPGMTGFAYRGVIAIDSSGSVSAKELQYYLGAINVMLEGFAAFSVDVLAFSTTVHTVHHYETGDDIRTFTFNDRGGTMIEPVFDWVKQTLPPCDVGQLIVLTDGGILDIDALPFCTPSYSVLWVLSQAGSFDPPFGHTVMLNCP